MSVGVFIFTTLSTAALSALTWFLFKFTARTLALLIPVVFGLIAGSLVPLIQESMLGEAFEITLTILSIIIGSTLTLSCALLAQVSKMENDIEEIKDSVNN